MFLYFFPGLASITQSQIDAAGLRYALGPNDWQQRSIVIGPGQDSGLLVCRSKIPADSAKFDAALQKWRRIPKQNVYCGRWTDRYTHPTDLERPMQCASIPIQLADEQIWNIAQARKFIEVDQTRFYYNPLPQDLDLDDSGNWTPSRVSAHYERLSSLADKYWEAQSAALDSSDSSGVTRFVFEEIDELAVESITANYFVSHIELALLRAYNVQVRMKVIEATLDQAFVKSMLEKKTDAAPAGSDSAHGPTPTHEALKPDTPQPTAS